jgi:Ni,Fe-hydrogenase III small subunit/formate hydrogenlyase subunit 6/NADH:ubiquinone oxidoreductase subunit I
VLREFIERIKQGYRTMPYPRGEAVLPDRFRGMPMIDGAACAPDCRACVAACPTGAIGGADKALTLDMGRCLFCADCAAACPDKTLQFSREHRLAAWAREDLILRDPQPAPQAPSDPERLSLFRRSLKLRQVSAGGCNGCEAELNAAGNVQFDLSRFGIQFVASPRHADGLVVTGPVTGHMRSALLETWEATPAPKLLIAVGACACSGGAFAGSPACGDGLAGVAAELGVPVDLWIPGCPPHPVTLLDGLLRLLGRVEGDRLALAGTGVLEPGGDAG